jgi:hypothetical protein
MCDMHLGILLGLEALMGVRLLISKDIGISKGLEVLQLEQAGACVYTM